MSSTSTATSSAYETGQLGERKREIHKRLQVISTALQYYSLVGSVLDDGCAYRYSDRTSTAVQSGGPAVPDSPDLSPNPPKDTDGRREESGRGVRELQGK